MVKMALVALAVVGSAAGPQVRAGAIPEAVRRVELLYPGSYRLTLVAGRAGAVAVQAPGPAPARIVLSRPGDAASFRKAPGDPAATATWRLSFLEAPGAPGAGCDLDLEWSDEGGTLKVPFRVRTRKKEPRVEAVPRPGSFDQLRNYDGRSYYVKGPVTLVGATAHQDVLIAVTE